MRLSDVSLTAVATLRSRVIESRKTNPVIIDPMAELCLERLAELASTEERTRFFDRKLSPSLTRHLALRARKYDASTNRFIAENPASLVLNLGCGFDTRYWRINHEKCEYIELDLPGIIELKRETLKGRIDYETIGASVLEHSWIDRLNPDGQRRALLLAEGLFMYLPKTDVVALFRAIAGRFQGSRMVFEVVTEKYTLGVWKKLVEGKIRRQLGLNAGSSYNYGVRSAREVESYAKGLRVIEEWSYVDDPDGPRILKYLGLSGTQWTVTVEVN